MRGPALRTVSPNAAEYYSLMDNKAQHHSPPDPGSEEDYEEVVEEYSTSDEPDGTHRESHRITRTSHHPHTQQLPAVGDNAARDNAGREPRRDPDTRTTTIRTVTRTETHPEPPRRTPRTRLFRRMSAYRGEKNLAAWEERTSTPMFIASLLYLIAFAAPIISTRIQEPYNTYLNIFQLILWALFAADYSIRLYLAPRRLYFLTHNLMNLAIVLLPAWRIVSFLAMIHLTTNRQYKRLSELAVKLFGYTVIFIVMFALSIYAVESGEPAALIRDLPTAYWWTFATLATVGYGDVYPVTTLGRIIAGVVMVYGVGLFAVVTGALASWIIEKLGVPEEEHPASKADVDDLRLEIAELRALLAREYARREERIYTLREVVDANGTHLVPPASGAVSDAADGEVAGSGAPGVVYEVIPETVSVVPGAAVVSNDADAHTALEASRESVRESEGESEYKPNQEPVALLEETRQTFTIIREKFSLRSRK